MNWLAALSRHERAAVPCVLVTVLAAKGSAPREAGAKMVVAASGQDGSIGGGRLEHECSEHARALLGDPSAVLATRDFPLGPALGQCCGGHVTVLFEPVVPAPELALFGAGHVGQALVRCLADIPFRVRWVDARADAFPPEIPDNVTCVLASAPETVVADLAQGSMAVVMTHDHALDYRLVEACLRRGDLKFVGLIGSDTKRARFARRLRADGVSDAAMACPIGLPGIGGKLPAEIALSVAAQLMQVRDAVAVPRVPALARQERPRHGDGCSQPQACAACAVVP